MKTRRKLRWLIVMVIALTGLLPSASAFYAPAEQRWVNRDPLGETGFEVLRHGKANPLGDGPNSYLFVHGDPENNQDHYGLLCYEVYLVCPGPCSRSKGANALVFTLLQRGDCPPPVANPDTEPVPSYLYPFLFLLGPCRKFAVLY